MSNTTTVRGSTLHTTSQRLVLGVAAIFLLFITTWTSRSLYFVWEEWGHLWDAVESPAWGLLQSHNGYVSPLGRLLFLVEAKVFGHWYTGYTLINALLLIAVVALLWRIYRSSNPWSSWALTGGLVTFMFSAGALFAIHFAAMNAYFLAWLFGLMALRLWTLGRSPWLVGALLVAGGLSSTLMSLVVAALVLPSMIVLGRAGATPRWTWSYLRGPVGYGLVVVVISGSLYLLGRAFPSVDTSVGVDQAISAEVLQDPFAQLIPLGALLSVWLLTPFLAVTGLDQVTYERAVILFIDRPYLILVVFAILVGLLASTMTPRLGGRGWKRDSWFILLLIAAVVFAIQVAFLRSNNAIEVRYTLFWLPSIIVFWSTWIAIADKTRVRLIARLGTVLMAAAGIVAIASSPLLVDNSVDLIRPRTELSMQLKDQVMDCPAGSLTEVTETLAPGMPWQAVCDSAAFVRY